MYNIASPSSDNQCLGETLFETTTYNQGKGVPQPDSSLENFPDKPLKGVPQPGTDSFCQILCLKILMSENSGMHQAWHFEIIEKWKIWRTNHSNNIRITSWMVFFISKASFTRASRKAHVSRKSARKQTTEAFRKVLTSYVSTQNVILFNIHIIHVLEYSME